MCYPDMSLCALGSCECVKASRRLPAILGLYCQRAWMTCDYVFAIALYSMFFSLSVVAPGRSVLQRGEPGGGEEPRVLHITDQKARTTLSSRLGSLMPSMLPRHCFGVFNTTF